MTGALWMEHGTESALPDSGWWPMTMEHYSDPSQAREVFTFRCPNGHIRGAVDKFAVSQSRGYAADAIKQEIRATLTDYANAWYRCGREDREW